MKRRSSDTEEASSVGRRRRSALRKYQEIDHVRVEEVFSLKEPSSQGNKNVGESCYVTATVNNKRYYGTLVDQDALKSASRLHFQDTAAGLEINRRMKILKQRQVCDTGLAESVGNSGNSTQSGAEGPTPMQVPSTHEQTSLEASGVPLSADPSRQVQKFRFVEASNGRDSDFRILLATYSGVEAAAEDDAARMKAIIAACQAGGGFVGDYYYQYESQTMSLKSEEPASAATATRGLRMSMAFNKFLQNTGLPEWYPLSNLEAGQQQVLETLGMRKDNRGTLVWDENKTTVETTQHTTNQSNLVPMKPRSRYRVAVVGGGIAGLSCCLELFNICERDGIDVEVTLIEGRSRLGGRLWTDRETFKSRDSGQPLPVDLGASWIHGIDSNPLAAMALEAKVDFVQTSEEVTMLREGGVIVDQEQDEQAGELFDKLLDLAVETCWRDSDGTEEIVGESSAVRWYASGFQPSATCTDSSMVGRVDFVEPMRVPTGHHRDSSDTSVDESIGSVISKGKLNEVSTLTEDGQRMLGWNIKNVEYALGANICDLSMKFWDIDERHAFEGAHVILRQGYSSLVDHIYRKLTQQGDRFTCMLGAPVKRIEYARKTTCNPYFCSGQRYKRFVELSDTCQVTFESNNPSLPCDFVVCAVPLGVLKDSLESSPVPSRNRLQFLPDLPFSKQDSIKSVGFGLLDKIYLQFPFRFWKDILREGQTSFGNASSCNPHQYMFIDVGLSLNGFQEDSVPVLMTLISGREAVDSECLSEGELVAEVMRTLRTLFDRENNPAPPEPICFKVTRWGRDRFSRGSYTYLPPGTTDQDFRSLQTPVNGNGDASLLDKSETMRLFFAGEHTTALHPSMAHGAMLSGYRAAKEVVHEMGVSLGIDTNIDRTIPLSLFRYMNPKAKLSCALCHLSGSRVREGSLIAFKRGARSTLAHSSCAENCPEVGVKDGVWTNVIRACNRGKSVECSLCFQTGATIGCTDATCSRSYHFSCAEDTGWRFDSDGKEFICDLHRPIQQDHRKISLEFWLMKASDSASLSCALCSASNDRACGELLAFQKGAKQVLIHEYCARYTSTNKLVEDTSSRFENDFEDVFDAVENAQQCNRCSRDGATVGCDEPSCSACYHYHCAQSLDWDFSANPKFRCFSHRKKDEQVQAAVGGQNGEGFQHALFSLSGTTPTNSVPANLDAGEPLKNRSELDACSKAPAPAVETNHFRTEKLSEYDGDAFDVRLVNATRGSPKEPWNLTLEASISSTTGMRILCVSRDDSGGVDGLNPDDAIISMNGVRVGTPSLDTVEKALKVLAQEVEILMEVADGPGHGEDHHHDNVWGN